MPFYSYTVLNKEGKEKKGTVESADKGSAMAQLKKEGNTVLSLQDGSVLNKEINISFIKKHIKSRDLSVFCRQFTSIIKAGVSIVSALTMLGDQTENKRLQQSIYNLRDSVQKGETLGNSMRKERDVFPSLLINMVDAGEASGSLETALDRMAIHFEKEAKMKGMVKKALMYPMVLLCVTIGVLILMCVVVIPNFISMFEELEIELPLFTRVVVDFSNLMINRWYIFVGVIVVLVVAFKMYKSTAAGERQLARLAIKLPIFGTLIRKTACSRFARTLSTLLAAGIPLVESISITARTVGNVLFKDELENAMTQVQRGMVLSNVLKKNKLFPPMVLHMLSIGEETGNMEEMLTNAANYYDEEVEATTGQVMALMEPLIIVIMAVMVGIIIAAVYGPVMELSNSVA